MKNALSTKLLRCQLDCRYCDVTNRIFTGNANCKFALHRDKNSDFTHMRYLKMHPCISFSHCFTADSYIPMCILPQNTQG